MGIILRRFKDFIKHTSVHGFKFLIDKSLHWTERCFWLLFVGLSWYGASEVIKAQYDAYSNNPISFVVDTSYKDWDTHFPAVAICETENTERIEEVSDRLWGVNHDFNLEEVLKELAFFKGMIYYSSQFCGAPDSPPECVITTNSTYYAGLVRSKCGEALANCSWNGKPFECCDYFHVMDTELGTCFVINTVQGREVNKPKLKMVSNRSTGPGALQFDITIIANVYVMNEEDVPSLSASATEILNVGPEYLHRRLITIRNIDNDAQARHISPAKRKCRYTDENNLDVYRHYSYSACTVQCRKNAQLQMCNCTNFFIPNTPEHLKCKSNGLVCLSENLNELSVLKAQWSSRTGLYCDCLPSCTEAEIYTVSDIRIPSTNSYGTVSIELSKLPSERYRRNVVRGSLDLVVSAGGTGGLFLGISLLSIVELFYIFWIRPSCTVYASKNNDSDPWHAKYGTRTLEDNFSNFNNKNSRVFVTKKIGTLK